jgi:hypothetical protein
MSGDEVRKRIRSLLNERIDMQKKNFPRAGALSAGRRRKNHAMVEMDSDDEMGGTVYGGTVYGGTVYGGKKMSKFDRHMFMTMKHHPKYGGAWYDWFGNTYNKVKNELTNPDSVFRKDVVPVAQQAFEIAKTVAPLVGVGKRRKHKGGAWYDFIGNAYNAVKNEVVNPDSALRKNIIPEAQKLKQAYDVAKSMAPLMGVGKRKKRGGKKDGRNARAEIVKKVMREKHLSMIEASKYVKAHGLY